MKKIISLVFVLSLFCCVGIFADDKAKNDEDVLNKKEMEQAGKYIEEMTSFVETFMNSFKNFVYQDEKQETVNTDDKKLSGLTLFSKKKDGEIITTEQVRIFQILKPNTALTKAGSFPNEVLMLLVGDDDDLYYDDQKINIPEGKAARQVGIYQYNTKSGELKTIPAVKIK
ncbi:MAG: hypothetical protein J6T23_02740 [Elusimicrobia bacterium]|nr:hypothetical protein [Elusimicrobiota bacterium]